MVKRMLIDATHPEETRVVVVNGTRLEEFDVETSTKKQLKGNIYLAKVVRVEPSLQAAFVDYGGNRHGFLAFSEIHPDYYQIPVADRKALLAEQRRALRDVDADGGPADAEDSPAEAAENAAPAQAADSAPAEGGEPPAPAEAQEAGEAPESVGGDEAEEMAERRRPRPIRNYKIQEVIKRRQIMLVQVVKEERGNKGAALTTYLSLAGRYCVLMPNTARGGGVSRKITNANDRKRLKTIANELAIPDSMALIVRTAGSERTKPEIKRDYEYLLRLWDNIRELTLRSVAPALVYEEANLIKRSIRDLYARDIDEILVDGDEGYRLAKDFMRMLTPSHAKKVQPYRDTMPMLHRYQVESQLDAMHSPVAQLRSGGYIVINPTEALVSIDVNSGRSTKERHIEETALKTNLEAAEEIARQLRLRDLAGLIVIDFIDMEEPRNNHAVERKLKEAMRFDRARIQLGRISPFGLLEMSRQRLRPSLMETSFTPCVHCGGTGMVRSVESTAVHILRVIEEEGIRGRSSEMIIHVPTVVALYILNQKRTALTDIENRYRFRVFVQGDDELISPAYRMERVKTEPRPTGELARPAAINPTMTGVMLDEVEDVAEPEDEAEDQAPEAQGSSAVADEQGEGDRRRRKRRKRRRRGGEGEGEGEIAEGGFEAGEEGLAETAGEDAESDEDEDEGDGDAESRADGQQLDENGEPRRKRRRGKRGGRRRNRQRINEDGTIEQIAEAGEGFEDEEAAPEAADTAETAPADAAVEGVTVEEVAAEVEAAAEKPKRSRSRKKAEPAAEGDEAAEKPKRSRSRKKAEPAEAEAVAEAVAEDSAPLEETPEVQASEEPAAEPQPQPEPEPMAEQPSQPEDPPQPPRRGWWNRLTG